MEQNKKLLDQACTEMCRSVRDVLLFCPNRIETKH